MKHLKPEQLIAFREGDTTDRRVLEHLATCQDCQRELEEARWLEAVTPSGGQPGEHPSGDVLRALVHNALSTGDSAPVREHLRACDRCLYLYGKLRGRAHRARFGTPSQSAISTAKAASRRRPLVELGQLLIRLVGDRVALSHLPPKSSGRVWDRMADLSAEQSLGSLPEDAAPPHPAAASARRRRISSTREERDRGPVTIDADDLLLTLGARVSDNRVLLRILAQSSRTGEPVSGLPLRVEQRAGAVDRAETDEDGAAEVALPPGAARLEVGSRPARRIEIRHLD